MFAIEGTIGIEGQLAYIIMPEGRLLPAGDTFTREYNLNDHLGNVRVTLAGNGSVLSENHYYPFGLQIAGLSAQNYASTQEPNKYLYNGKENQDEFGLEWLDYGFRYYDAQRVVFPMIDPLAEQYPFQSPYVYAANNPVRFIDKNGMNADDFYFNKQGELIRHDVNDKPDRYFLVGSLNTKMGVNFMTREITELKVNFTGDDFKKMWVNSNPTSLSRKTDDNPVAFGKVEQAATCILDTEQATISLIHDDDTDNTYKSSHIIAPVRVGENRTYADNKTTKVILFSIHTHPPLGGAEGASSTDGAVAGYIKAPIYTIMSKNVGKVIDYDKLQRNNLGNNQYELKKNLENNSFNILRDAVLSKEKY